MEFSASLLQLPAGGQVVLSDTTFQRIGGRLHEVKLPAFELQRPSLGLDGQPRGRGDGQRNSLDGKPRQKLEGQVRPEGQQTGQTSPASSSSRRNSLDTSAELVVIYCTCSHSVLCSLKPLSFSQATSIKGGLHSGAAEGGSGRVYTGGGAFRAAPLPACTEP